MIKSIFLFVVFLELFFWIGAWATQRGQIFFNALRARDSGVYRIMCIGESTTLLGEQKAYPAQLELILNQHAPKKPFQVINQGMAGVNTATILSRLPPLLQTYKPDMVVAMIGSLDALEDQKESAVPAFINSSKLYHVLGYFGATIAQRTKEILEQYKRKSANPASKEKHFDSEYEMFQDAIGHQPEEQYKLYVLLGLALKEGRYEIAEKIYERFFETNKNPVIHAWLIKKYGELVIKMGKYEKFVNVMSQIPYNAWHFEWVKAYCHGDKNMEHVKNVIEGMVHKGTEPLVYGYAAACYEEGGRQDLAGIFLKKMGAKSSFYANQTRKNYMALKEMLLSRGIQPVFVQYPMRDIRPLLSIFEGDLDKERVIFVDNGPVFQQAVRNKSYEIFFADRALGDLGHGTLEGNRLLAANVAKKILAHLDQ